MYKEIRFASIEIRRRQALQKKNVWPVYKLQKVSLVCNQLTLKKKLNIPINKKKNSFKWSPLFCWMMIQINSYDKMEYR